jgi:ATP-dependent RNA helicase DDX3X
MSDFGNGVNVEADKADQTPGNKELAENLAALKEKGWNNPIPFNYESVAGASVKPEDAAEEPAWLGGAAIYEWDDDFGDIGPENPVLEEELFRGEHLMKAGHQIKALQFDVKIEGKEQVPPVREVSATIVWGVCSKILTRTQFEHAGLHPALMANVKLCGYRIPTPIQAYTIPAVLTGHDVVGVAQTGKSRSSLIELIAKDD